MADPVSGTTRGSYTTFGQLLKYLRKQAHLTQRQLAGGVGYSPSQISRLENNKRPPDLTTIAARFVPTLGLQSEPEIRARLLALAAAARGEPVPDEAAAPRPAEPGPGAGEQDTSPAAPASVVTGLPFALTRFIGRQHETAEVCALIGGTRLTTLTGAGGVGKSRLAVRVAEVAQAGFRDGGCLVELAPLSDPALVAQHLAATLGLRDEPGQPILGSLTAHLRERNRLIVLDNCEHLLEACARLAFLLLQACPTLHILATSREALGITGEAIFQVPTLDFPDPNHLPPLQDVRASLAVTLFTDRARLVWPGFQVTPRNAGAVTRICWRLDGIPLALELAAARMQHLSAEQLANRLDDVFSVLTLGSRTALPQHQTLRATIDWSYNLLSVPERLLLQRLSVFAGDFTLEAAEAVCADEALAGGEVLNCLTALASKSMVLCDLGSGEEARYRLLEMVRQYAREILQAGGVMGQVQQRHHAYYFTLARTMYLNRTAAAHIRLVWRAKLKAAQENLRLALEWSFQDGVDPASGPWLVIYAMTRWPLTNQEALDWCSRAIDWCRRHPQLSPVLSVRLMTLHAMSLARFDLSAAVAGLERAIDAGRGLGPEGKSVLLWSLFDLGSLLAGQGALEPAQAAWNEAETILKEVAGELDTQEWLWTCARFAEAKAGLENQQGHNQAAKFHAGESIRLEAANGDPRASYSARKEMGHACLALAEYEQARYHYREALAIVEEMLQNVLKAGPDYGDWGLADMRQCLGRVDLQQGYLERALECFRASLEEARKIPDRHFIARGLALSAQVWARRGCLARAATLAGAAHGLFTSSGRATPPDLDLTGQLTAGREGPSRAAVADAFEAGRLLTLAEAVGIGLSQECE